MRVLHQQRHTHASCYSREWRRTDPEEKKSSNKVVICVFFVHKKYSRSFIKIRLNLIYVSKMNEVLRVWKNMRVSN